MNMDNLRHRIYEILEGTREDDTTSRVVQGLIIALIVINVVAVVLGTVPALYDEYARYFEFIEIASIIVFSIEYVLRVWVALENEDYNRPVLGRLRYMVTPGALIDLVAILPFFLPMVASGLDLRGIRAVRIFRLFRLMKIGRYSTSVTLLGGVLRDKKEQIGLALTAVLVILVFASSAMYFIERSAQPDHFSSIPQAMWWGIITLTTVGYGGVYPVTTLGQIVGGVISLLGIGLFALPAGILASGFETALEKKHGDLDEEERQGKTPDLDRDEYNYCPCCGRKLEDGDEGKKPEG